MIVETLGEAFKQLDLAGDLNGDQETSVGGDVSAAKIGFDATGLGGSLSSKLAGWVEFGFLFFFFL